MLDARLSHRGLTWADRRASHVISHARWYHDRAAAAERAGAALAEANGNLEHAEGRLRHLLDQHEAEQAAIAARPEIEQAGSKVIKAMVKELEDSRAALATAITQAQQTLIEVMDRAETHNALIQAHSDALTAAGLTYLPGGPDFDTGGTRDAVRLKGAWWARVDAAPLLVWTMHRVATARLGQRHPLTGMLRRFGDRLMRGRIEDLLLAEVPDLPVMTEPVVVRPHRGPLKGAQVGVLSPEATVEKIRRELEGWTRPVPDGEGGTVMERCPAPDHVKADVQRRIANVRKAASKT